MAQVSDLPVPRIHFGTKSQPLLREMLSVGATVIGVDAQTPLDVANEILGGNIPLQGNINPELLSAPWEVLAVHVTDVIKRGAVAPAHVVNLGHGVPPDTDPELLTRMVAFAHGDFGHSPFWALPDGDAGVPTIPEAACWHPRGRAQPSTPGAAPPLSSTHHLDRSPRSPTCARRKQQA